VWEALGEIFPTELERNLFQQARPASLGVIWQRDQADGRIKRRFARLRDLLDALQTIRTDELGRYTDLPAEARLYIEDIDSFAKARDINHTMVDHLLKGGYLDIEENDIQVAFEEILDEPFHKQDWSGEINDLYSSNLVVNGRRTATAFLLKGRGLRKRTMEIASCGKNGDQLLRLFDSPASLFIVQFVGRISEAVIRDVEGKIDQKRRSGSTAWFCAIDGQDTARILLAYNKLPPA
jgi:hypothetical protein